MENDQAIIPQSPHFPTGKWELRYGIMIAIVAIIMANCILYGGLNLGFAISCTCCILLSMGYLIRRGHRPTAYTVALTAINILIALSFLRSDDGFVKFVMACFLLVSGNLSLTLMSGQNRRNPNGITSLLDAPRAVFALGVGQMGNAVGGLNDARKNMGGAGKRSMAVLTGLIIAVPILAILIPLLMGADAAFEGLIDLLPEFEITELVVTLIFGVPIAIVLYTRNTALHAAAKAEPSGWTPRKIDPITIATVLAMVCVVYLVYLFSQLAYFVDGFRGILPDEFTLAQYARRGFFEMAWLSAINLAIITLSAALSLQRPGRASKVVRAFNLFIGAVTLFLTVTASAKMFLYIDSYGLTRLRLLTEIIMIFIALTVIFVSVWLLKPKFAYMKAVLLTALIMGACVAWADVDTMVAAYNVTAYQSGQLETVDMSHLCALGDGAAPYIQQLADDPDPNISRRANAYLNNSDTDTDRDLRGFNIASSIAKGILAEYQTDTDQYAEDSEYYP